MEPSIWGAWLQCSTFAGSERHLFALDVGRSRGHDGSVTPNQFRSALVFAVVLVLALVMPSAFLIESPGRVLEVTGEESGEAMIRVEGARTYPSDTSLYMTTVSAMGDSSSGAPAGAVAASLFNPRWQVFPVRALYPAGMTREQQDKRSEGQMASSQSAAEIVALEKAGYEVTMVLEVSNVPEASPAYGKLAEGDVLRWISRGETRVEATSYSRFLAFLADVEPGSEVTVGYEREGRTGEATIVTEAIPADETGWARSGSRLGIGLIPSDIETEAEVAFALEEVGGPSAGSMFALGIYDELTEGSLGADAAIAGTGTIALSGEIGPIGGIVHKMRGAEGKGIDYFLAPASNCDEVVGNEPQGMDVFAVRTFDEARDAVRAIGAGTTNELVTCETILKEG